MKRVPVFPYARPMTDLGFWRLAASDPDRTVLVDPDGNDVKAGDLLARANQVANGLRARGLGKGDTIATLLPNSLAMLEVYLGAMQIGLYVTPINFHLVGPEVAYILGDSEAKVFITDERFTETATAAVEEIGFPEDRRFMAGTAGPGLPPHPQLCRGPPG